MDLEVIDKSIIFNNMVLGESASRRETRTEARAWSTAQGLPVEEEPDKGLSMSCQASQREIRRF